MTGSIGLAPTLAALDAGAPARARQQGVADRRRPAGHERARPGQIVPVDSEHSALAQCLRGGAADEVRRLVLTASGGPFRGRTRDELADVTPAQALAHPTWDMGPVVTINSRDAGQQGPRGDRGAPAVRRPATTAIDVVVHPQSVVHSMVEFVDGSTIAQASPPDMRLPIALALGWPDRVPGAAPAVRLDRARDLDLRAARRRRRSRPCGWPARPARAAAPRRRSSTPPTRSASRRSSPGGCRSSRIVDTVAQVVGGARSPDSSGAPDAGRRAGGRAVGPRAPRS